MQQNLPSNPSDRAMDPPNYEAPIIGPAQTILDQDDRSQTLLGSLLSLRPGSKYANLANDGFCEANSARCFLPKYIVDLRGIHDQRNESSVTLSTSHNDSPVVSTEGKTITCCFSSCFDPVL